MWAGCRRFLLPYRLGCRGGATHTRSRAGVLAGIISVFCFEEQIGVLDAILQFFRALFNPDGLRELIRAGGSPLICTIVFVETGRFVRRSRVRRGCHTADTWRLTSSAASSGWER